MIWSLKGNIYPSSGRRPNPWLAVICFEENLSSLLNLFSMFLPPGQTLIFELTDLRVHYYVIILGYQSSTWPICMAQNLFSVDVVDHFENLSTSSSPFMHISAKSEHLTDIGTSDHGNTSGVFSERQEANIAIFTNISALLPLLADEPSNWLILSSPSPLR